MGGRLASTRKSSIPAKVLATLGKMALTVFEGAELSGAGVGELGEVRRGPKRRRGQDVRRVAEVQVGQRARQVAHRQRGADAVMVPLFVAAQPVAGAQIQLSETSTRAETFSTHSQGNDSGDQSLLSTLTIFTRV